MAYKYLHLGVCPDCGREELSYGNSHLEGEALYYEVICDNCGWTGREWYNLTFTEYTDEIFDTIDIQEGLEEIRKKNTNREV